MPKYPLMNNNYTQTSLMQREINQSHKLGQSVLTSLHLILFLKSFCLIKYMVKSRNACRMSQAIILNVVRL